MSLAVGIAHERRFALAPAWLAGAVPVALAVWTQARFGMMADVSWLIDCDERWLDGAVPYRDFIETNPPASLWLYLPAVAAARALGLRSELLVSAYGFALAAVALALGAAILRRVAPEKKIAIEVDDVKEAREAIDAGFDILQLERFSIAEVSEVAALANACPAPPLIAAAGGVTVANAADYVRAGAGMIVTSAPFGAPPADVNVSIAEVKSNY